MMLYEKWGQGLPLTLIKEYRDVYNFMRFGILGSESEEKRKEERAKSKGPRLNSLHSFSSKNLTGPR
jgi:hypothetical protein